VNPYREVMGVIGTVVDAIGVIVIFVGALIATARFLLRRYDQANMSYQSYRQDIGRAILLGLEFLIAGDIIRTVVVAPSLGNVVVLGIIVLIRTFLSTSLQLELEGRWPWQPPSNL
jgi:uncharacterized membrane protein